jgi:hypothetical protein
VLHQLPRHRTLGRSADPSVGLLGDEPAQCGKAARARLEALPPQSGQPGAIELMTTSDLFFRSLGASGPMRAFCSNPLDLMEERVVDVGDADQGHARAAGRVIVVLP